LTYANKPLPALPKGSLDRSNPDVRKIEKELNAKGFYIQGGKKPIEVKKEGKLVKVGREKVPREPI